MLNEIKNIVIDIGIGPSNKNNNNNNNIGINIGSSNKNNNNNNNIYNNNKDTSNKFKTQCSKIVSKLNDCGNTMKELIQNTENDEEFSSEQCNVIKMKIKQYTEVIEGTNA